MSGRPEIGTPYRVGAGGLRVVYRDGTEARHAAFSTVTFEHVPLKVEGRLFEIGSHFVLTYEAPQIGPEH